MGRVCTVAFCCLAALIAAMAVQAKPRSYLDQVAKTLRSSPVYVAPGTPGTNADTADVLATQLTEKDNTFIVMLPAEALKETEGDINVFVRKVDTITGHTRIIGLAVGDQLVGYSTKLPPGKAAELMERAKNVTQFPVETLSTFIANVHDWQVRNPPPVEPKPKPKPPGEKDDGEFPWWTMSFIAVLLVVIWLVVRKARRSELAEVVPMKASPDQVRELISKIYEQRKELQDRALGELLLEICRHTEAYFARASGAKQRDANTFRGHLKSLYDVLDKYIDIERYPLYYDDPERLLRVGREAFKSFDTYVLDSIRRGSRQALTEFNVDTDILAAQKYR